MCRIMRYANGEGRRPPELDQPSIFGKGSPIGEPFRLRGMDITEDEVEEIYLKYKDNPLVEIMRQEIRKKMDH